MRVSAFENGKQLHSKIKERGVNGCRLLTNVRKILCPLTVVLYLISIVLLVLFFELVSSNS